MALAVGGREAAVARSCVVWRGPDEGWIYQPRARIKDFTSRTSKTFIAVNQLFDSKVSFIQDILSECLSVGLK